MKKVMDMFKKATIGNYLIAGSSILVLVTLIMGCFGHALALNANFDVITIIVMAISVVVSLLAPFCQFEFWPFLPCACNFVALGLIINGGVPVIADKMNNITFQGGNFTLVVVYIVLMIIACILTIVSSYMPSKKD